MTFDVDLPIDVGPWGFAVIVVLILVVMTVLRRMRQVKASRQIAKLGDTRRAVVVYCASGVRSAVAVQILKRAGFTEVADLGPMSRW